METRCKLCDYVYCDKSVLSINLNMHFKYAANNKIYFIKIHCELGIKPKFSVENFLRRKPLWSKKLSVKVDENLLPVSGLSWHEFFEA